jgi:hypothetical protein
MSPPMAVEASRGGEPGPLLRRLRPVHVIVVVAALAAVLPLSRLLATPPFVERITFVNPTAYDLTVEVAGRERDRWMAVATLRRRAATETGKIFDVGDVWVFRFAGQGEDGGELRLTRPELEQSGWRVEVPVWVADQIEAQGAPPPP